jgi:hypothetical protein
MTLDQLVHQLQGGCGDVLQAAVLYGSAAAGEAVEGRSDLNVLAVVREADLGMLRRLAPTMRAWQEAGNPPVLVLTTAEWHRSADIFPMEYADILERHRVLAGALALEGIAVRPAELRLQLEQEAMGKLLRLRRGAMLAGTDPARQRALLVDSLAVLLVLFRAYLRLLGVRPAQDRVQVIHAAADRAGFDAAPFVRGQALVRGTPLADADVDAVLAGYIRGLDTLVSVLDAHHARGEVVREHQAAPPAGAPPGSSTSTS